MKSRSEHHGETPIDDRAARPIPLWIPLWAVLCFCLYLPGGSLVLNSREVADFSLAEAMFTRGRFDIPFIDQTGDLATNNGKYYVDRGPGNAFFALPFYMLGKGLTLIDIPPLTAQLYATRLGAAFYAAATIYLFLLLCLRLGGSPGGSFLAAFSLGLGTILWRYATIFYSHITAAFLVMLSLCLFRQLRRNDRPAVPFCLGLTLGLNVTVEYGNALLVPLFLIARYAEGEAAPRQRLRRLAPIILGGLGPLLFLLIYHWLCFDSPFSTGFQHQIHFDYNKSGRDMFSTPWSVGIPGLLVSLRYQGLLYASPIVLFAVGGLFRLYRQARAVTLRAAAGFLAALLFYARYRVFWGATSDTRYLVPVIPLLFLGFPAALDWLLAPQRDWRLRTGALLVFAILLIRSVFWAFLQTAAFYDHPFDTPELLQLVILNNPAGIIDALRAAFPSHIWALPFAALALLITLGALAFAYERRRKE